jgi:uncharacterized membrane protein
LRALRPWTSRARSLPIWAIPVAYASGSLLVALVLPRFEHAYLRSFMTMSPSSATAVFSSVASGMIALTAIVFSIAYVTVQFSAIAYSPRLAMWLARDPILFHALGIFIATFLYALAALAWIDRDESSGVPLISSMVVLALLSVSMFVFVLLVRGLANMTVTNMLHLIGDRGREVVGRTFERLDATGTAVSGPDVVLGPVTQTIKYSGGPRSIAELDTAALVRLARDADAVIELTCAVGDSLVDDTPLVRVYRTVLPLPETHVLKAITLTLERTFEQDPKYPIRLLVDIAIKALSPAINDPTTAVQAIDQIEDLLRRLGRRALDAGYARDERGVLRLVFPMPTWEDYLRLSFDEIRQFGATSVQVMRRLRAALAGIAESVADETRTAAVQQYLRQLDVGIERSALDAEDRATASEEDRQGLGVSRKRAKSAAAERRPDVLPLAQP